MGSYPPEGGNLFVIGRWINVKLSPKRPSPSNSPS